MRVIIKPPEKTRERLKKAIEKDGFEIAAGRLRCSVLQVQLIVRGERNPSLRLAGAIEEVYKISMRDWIDGPASRTIAS